MKRLKVTPRIVQRAERQIISEEESIRRLKTIKRWREKKLAELKKEGRVPRSTR